MIRITCVSDLHGNLPKIEPCQLLLIAGDICPDAHSLLQAQWLGVAFKDWLDGIPADEVVLVFGNHDLVAERAPHLLPRDLRCHILQDDLVEIKGLKIYGLPWISPIWGAFNKGEETLARKYKNIPDDTDIIISHGPPFGIGDNAARRHYSADNETDWPTEHCGSPSFRERIFEIMPLIEAHGHIHEDRGVYKHGWPDEDSMVIINAALCDQRNEMVHEPIVLEVDKEKKKVLLLSGI